MIFLGFSRNFVSLSILTIPQSVTHPQSMSTCKWDSVHFEFKLRRLNFNITWSTAESCRVEQTMHTQRCSPSCHGFCRNRKALKVSTLRSSYMLTWLFLSALWGEQHNYRDNNIKSLVLERVWGGNSWSHFKHPHRNRIIFMLGWTFHLCG